MKKIQWIPYMLAGIALLIGATQDYAITLALYHPNSIFGLIFERFILIPFQLLLVLHMCLLYRTSQKKVFVCLGVGFSFYVLCDTFHYWMSIKVVWLLFMLFIMSICVTWLILKLSYFITNDMVARLLIFLRLFTLMLLTTIFITTIIKYGWGRVRFRDLEDVSSFCVWYKPCGVFGNQSFPSAHTAAFSSILCFLRWKRNPKEQLSPWRYICIGVLICLMSLSRMIIGAHYLSDTAMGFIIAYSCYLLYRNHFIRGGSL